MTFHVYNFNLLWIIFLACQNFVQAQSSGTIKFKHTTYLEAEGLPKDFPTSFTNMMILKYDQQKSIYQRDPTYIEESPPSGRMRFMRMAHRNNNVYYKNHDQKTTVEQVEFFGKNFVISDTLEKLPWKISAGEQKTIAGKLCMKATYSDSTSKFVAFFSPQIPIFTGPDKYSSLPGIILEIQSARMHIIATEIIQGLVDIEVPNKGDKVSRDEFKNIRNKKISEQKEMWGDRGNIRIIRQ
jgi:GLPGLI family protein